MLRWRLFLEEYGAECHYIQGSKNVLAGAFSRLPWMDPPSSEGKDSASTAVSEETLYVDGLLLDCFVNFPADGNTPNPLDLAWIQQEQFNDQRLQQLRQAQPHLFPIKCVDNLPLMCFCVDPVQPENEWCICIPTHLLQDTIRWFHTILGHGGKSRTYDTIRRMYHHPDLKQTVDAYKCRVCQRRKLQGSGYGELPPREAIMMPWQEVHVDLIRPWIVKVDNVDHEIKFQALTCVDPVTNIVEMVRIDNKTAEHIAQQFQNLWLCRYPRPLWCIHDNGGEFIGWEFQRLLYKAKIEDAPITSKNPQGNATCERMH